jgi:hypothetical protein
MEGDKMVLIAYHMLESSIGAYIEWLADAVTHKPDSFVYPWSLFISS